MGVLGGGGDQVVKQDYRRKTQSYFKTIFFLQCIQNFIKYVGLLSIQDINKPSNRLCRCKDMIFQKLLFWPKKPENPNFVVALQQQQ